MRRRGGTLLDRKSCPYAYDRVNTELVPRRSECELTIGQTCLHRRLCTLEARIQIRTVHPASGCISRQILGSHDLVVGLLVLEKTVQCECESMAVLRVKPRTGIPLRLGIARVAQTPLQMVDELVHFQVVAPGRRAGRLIQMQQANSGDRILFAVVGLVASASLAHPRIRTSVLTVSSESAILLLCTPSESARVVRRKQRRARRHDLTTGSAVVSAHKMLRLSPDRLNTLREEARTPRQAISLHGRPFLFATARSNLTARVYHVHGARLLPLDSHRKPYWSMSQPDSAHTRPVGRRRKENREGREKN